MTDSMHARAIYRADLGAHRFEAEAGLPQVAHTLSLDNSHVEVGQRGGASPMELMLVSLAGCLGMSVVPILRKMRQDITGYEIRVRGERSSEWPKIFTAIAVEHRVAGHALKAEAVERAVTLAEERYCGVSAMLGKAVPITHTVTVVAADVEDAR